MKRNKMFCISWSVYRANELTVCLISLLRIKCGLIVSNDPVTLSPVSCLDLLSLHDSSYLSSVLDL